MILCNERAHYVDGIGNMQIESELKIPCLRMPFMFFMSLKMNLLSLFLVLT